MPTKRVLFSGSSVGADHTAAPEGPQLLVPTRLRPVGLRLFGEGVGLPDPLARRRVEGDDAAAKGAALVARVGRRSRLDRRDADVEAPAENSGRTGDLGVGMFLDHRSPAPLAAGEVDGVDRGGIVTEVGVGRRLRVRTPPRSPCTRRPPPGGSSGCTRSRRRAR